MKLLANNQMARAFGGYDFQTPDMKEVCRKQAELTRTEIIRDIKAILRDAGDLKELERMLTEYVDM